MPGACKFRDEWVQKAEYLCWLKKCENIKEAYCKLSKIKIFISSMGEGALKSHSKATKGKREICCFSFSQLYYSLLFMISFVNFHAQNT